jgi:hypothetical protein
MGGGAARGLMHVATWVYLETIGSDSMSAIRDDRELLASNCYAAFTVRHNHSS